MADNKQGYTQATGSSSEADRVYYKKLRGEDLSPQEWKIWREQQEAIQAAKNGIYGVAPF